MTSLQWLFALEYYTQRVCLSVILERNENHVNSRGVLTMSAIRSQCVKAFQDVTQTYADRAIQQESVKLAYSPSFSCRVFYSH